MKTSHKNGFHRAHEHTSQKRETLQNQPGDQPYTKLEIAAQFLCCAIVGLIIAALFYLV